MLSLAVSDKELLERMQAGDERAYATLFHRYWEELFITAAKRLGHASATKDAVQETLLAVWTRRHALKANENESLRPYLFTLLRYRIFDIIAQERQQEISYHVFQQFLSLHESHVLEDVIKKELFDVIRREIDAMPDTMRRVMLLSEYKGYSVSDIATELKVTEKTVRNLTSTAMGRIRECIGRYYAESSESSATTPAFIACVLLLTGI